MLHNFPYLSLLQNHFLIFRQYNSAAFLKKAFKLFAFLLVLFLLATPALAQNTKGDKAEVNGNRQSRFSGKKSKKIKGKKGYNRVTPGRFSLSNLARPFQGQRKPGSSKAKLYSQNGPYVNNPSKKPKTQRVVSNRTIKPRTTRSRGGKNNVFPQNGPYVNNPSKTPRDSQRPVSNKTTLARLNKIQGSPKKDKPPGRKQKVTPRTASSSFLRFKTINANAGFWNVRKKGEQAVTTDLAGKPLRTKNFRTPSREIIPSVSPYLRTKRIGDRPYSSTSRNYVKISPRSRQNAWRGDIAGRRIRGKNFSSKSRIEGTPILGGKRSPHGRDRGFRGIIPGGGYTQSKDGRRGNAPLIVSGVGAGGINYTGGIKRQRPLKGGGSRSGAHWNNNGNALAKRITNVGIVGIFQGNNKAQRPIKGGGSVSGRGWNNNGSPLVNRFAGTGSDRIGNFKGNIPTNRPVKGGGSLSGKTWNNGGLSLPKRVFGSDRVARFQGNIPSGKPIKGGGSVSGQIWNNNGSPLVNRSAGIGSDRLGNFHGNIRSSKPVKGGGSVSGKIWNNNGSPLVNRSAGIGSDRIGNFQGNIPSRKSYVQNPKAAEGSIKKRKLMKEAFDVDDLGIKVKRRNYVVNKNSAEDALLKLKPTETTKAVDNLQISVKRRNYVVNKNAAEESLRKLKPTETDKAVANLQIKVKQYHYIHNPSSNKEALDVREPGKAFARATDYQGNIKMKKFDLFSHRNTELHPDSKFVKTNKNNVDEERDLLTNIKLWWARNFKKNDTQPDNLKEKEHKPRYDKGEQGMWSE